VTLLPSDKADIHKIYQEAAKSLNYRASLSSDLDVDSSWDLPMAWANKNVFLHIW
jgi:hypothetical protein